MNERHLFRGKRTDNGEWVTGGYCEIPSPPQAFGELQPSQICIFTENPNTITDWGMPRQMCLIDVDPATIGQCTGLRDKNGKLIFEGDVIKQDEEKHVCGAIGVVSWDEKYGGWFATLRSPESPFEIDETLPLTEVNEFEYVYGNIHDTPELINI